LVAQTYGTGSNGDYFGYDAVGRPTVKIQQTGTVNYQISAGYNLAGGITSVTYPSGHAISNLYDAAGRLTTFSGNLGDGASRTYADNINYSSFGGLTRERFGTDTSIYHKTFYNIRGQLFDTRVSSVNDTWDWNRGRLILYYSSNHLWGQSGADNNGNVRFAETWIPPENATLDQAQVLIEQAYNYDALNRLTSVTEQKIEMPAWVWQQQLQQSYSYDRYGNRTINAAQTWGTGVNNKQFTVDASTNRLGVPNGQPGAMSYDTAGNLTNDTYTGAGNRTYDAENKITSAWGGNNQAQLYAYDASGQRIKRTVNGTETWQVYGIGGELLAEYPVNGATASPQKEYGYRNGQLLLTAEAGSAGTQNVNWTNAVGVSISGNNLTRTIAGDSWSTGAISSQIISSGDGYAEFTAGETNKRRAVGLTSNTSVIGFVHISYGMILGDDGTITINESNGVYGVFGTYTTGDKLRVSIESGVVKYRKNGTLLRTSTVAPTYPLYAGAALYTNASTVTGAVVTSNLHSAIWTNGVGVSISNNNLTRTMAGDGWSTGATSSQSIASGDGYAEFTATETNKKRSVGLTSNTSVTTFHHITYGMVLGDNGTITIHEGTGVYGVFGTYATGDKLRVAIEGGVVKYRKNGTLVRTSTLAPTYPLYAGAAIYSNAGTVTNAVLTSGSIGSTTQFRWLVTDHLGTPRMIFDQTGDLANMTRHDYLPFGEELLPPTGGRTAAMGYAGGDGVRQQFTAKERDIETGLDYFLARYYSSSQGRFVSVDPSRKSVSPIDPQSWNRYTYSLNKPLTYIDQNGKWPTKIHDLIVDRALPRLSAAQRQEIKNGSWSVDDPLKGGQNTDRSNEHGMTIPEQSQDEAAANADTFINRNVDAAKYNFEHHGLTSSLYDFGRAFHTVSDMTSPAHEGYQVWRTFDTRSHMKRESSINHFYMGLAVGATLALYKYTYGQVELDRATGYTPGSENDPNVEAIRAQYGGPGSSQYAEAEALYDYRRGLREGLDFDWGRQRGRRGAR
jgi:RHS repeat-associated protein